MIWDEALSEMGVIRLKNSARLPWNTFLSEYRSICYGNCVSRLFQCCGFDPGNIALSCKEAAARWRAAYPLYQPLDLLHQPTLGYALPPPQRLNQDRMILLAETELDLQLFMSSSTYKPRHVACVGKIDDHLFTTTGRMWPCRTLDGWKSKPNLKQSFADVQGIFTMHSINSWFPANLLSDVNWPSHLVRAVQGRAAASPSLPVPGREIGIWDVTEKYIEAEQQED